MDQHTSDLEAYPHPKHYGNLAVVSTGMRSRGPWGLHADGPSEYEATVNTGIVNIFLVES